MNKISEMPSASTLTGTELIEVLQDGTNKSVAVNLLGQGTQGLQGGDGAPGIQGIPGVAGASGIQGVAGVQGLPGADGTPGLQGAVGNTGLTGLQGDPGLVVSAPLDLSSIIGLHGGSASATGYFRFAAIPSADGWIPGRTDFAFTGAAYTPTADFAF